ncbi:cell division septum initiation protein DivIVA [Aurantimicrobium minutum]|uniref:hypothetical protein n=1 Tax=Aurantimicrobium minutum TaxID=708131 RepID=UPI0024730E6D|nr:hypothetical protein [Aurantimicrobium minutum]MDH6532283.1 cell division septum initiation protein DivIVA [Aurantimicrobium minutum]
MDISFPVVLPKKGLDPEEVNAALADTQTEAKRLEFELSESDKRIAVLNREIAEVRSALKRAGSKPSFSDLGAAFEQTLRVAEEQASKLLADARAESSQLREDALRDAEQLSVAASEHAEKLLVEAQERADRLLFESEKKLTEVVRSATIQLETAKVQFAEAEKLGEAIVGEGEQKRLLLESELAQEIDQARNEIATLRQLNEREQRRVNDETEAARAKAERESTRLEAENEVVIRHLLDDSERQFDEARSRARETLVEAQRVYAVSRQDGIARVRVARETAAEILRRARVRTLALNEKLEERNRELLENGQALVDELSFERESVESFNSEIRILSMSEGFSEDVPMDLDILAPVEYEEELTPEFFNMNDDSVGTPHQDGRNR